MRRTHLLPLLFSVALLAAPAGALTPIENAHDHYLQALADRNLVPARHGILFETIGGEVLLSQNPDQLYNPASVVKIATSACAIERLGIDYRYPTAFYASGTLDELTGELDGDSVVVGSGDPVFQTENAFLVARELRALGIQRVLGKLVVKGRFYVNFSGTPAYSGASLRAVLDGERWGRQTEAAYERFHYRTGAGPFEGVTIDGNVEVVPSLSVEGLTPLFVHRSCPLIRSLKQLNNYSNNWMAHMVGLSSGGTWAVKQTLDRKFGVPAPSVTLSTTSGLGSNSMSPHDIVMMLRGVAKELGQHGYGPTDLLPVAGIDPGTLDERFTAPGLAGAVVAKTGTLNGVSALAGYMYTKNRGIVLFAILNEGGNPHSFRPLQDLLVAEMLWVCGGPAPLPYRAPAFGTELAGALIEPFVDTAGRPRRVLPVAAPRPAPAAP